MLSRSWKPGWETWWGDFETLAEAPFLGGWNGQADRWTPASAWVDEKIHRLDAQQATSEAAVALASISTVLLTGLSRVISVESMCDYSSFPEAEPDLPLPTLQLPRGDWYGEPNKLQLRRLGIQQEEAKLEWEAAVENWRAEQAAARQEWAARKDAFRLKQAIFNEAIEDLWRTYTENPSGGIHALVQLVLSTSRIPLWCRSALDVEFIEETGIVVIDCQWPAPDELPAIKEFKYVRSRQEFQIVRLKDADLSRAYAEFIYQLVLLTLFEAFEADKLAAINAVSLNGYVRSIDRSTGQEVNPCIVTIQVTREDFLPINLSLVEPKACFRKLKGIGSAELVGLTAIAPIMRSSREDSRFVEGRSMESTMDSGPNIASMHWEEFEHLVRELFEREFASSGGEVKVTRASKDGGVDAVVFDPDPIRGGKIIIQAKRYTNVVGVSAVRELYATVLEEGATKGILVTTANFGADAYSFAKGKPITLISGNGLLHLLHKNGYRASIHLPDARKALGLRPK